MMIRRSRPTMAWYSLDLRTASGSTTSLASYTNPPVSAAPARAARSGRDARYDRDTTIRSPVELSVSFTLSPLRSSIVFGPADGSAGCAFTLSRPLSSRMGRRDQFGWSPRGRPRVLARIADPLAAPRCQGSPTRVRRARQVIARADAAEPPAGGHHEHQGRRSPWYLREQPVHLAARVPRIPERHRSHTPTSSGSQGPAIRTSPYRRPLPYCRGVVWT